MSEKETFFSKKARKALEKLKLNPNTLEEAIREIAKSRNIKLLTAISKIKLDLEEGRELDRNQKSLLRNLIRIKKIDKAIRWTQWGEEHSEGDIGGALRLDELKRQIEELPEDEKEYWQDMIGTVEVGDSLKRRLKEKMKKKKQIRRRPL